MLPVRLPLGGGLPVGCHALRARAGIQPGWLVSRLVRRNSVVMLLAMARSQVLGSGCGAGVVLISVNTAGPPSGNLVGKSALVGGAPGLWRTRWGHPPNSFRGGRCGRPQ